MFKLGDRVQVNLSQGTKTGTIEVVYDPPRGHEYYQVRLDEPLMTTPLLIETAIVNPWDVFLIDDERTE